ncbi:hypothetical protein L596_016115 [Steinernema carpocapsae]|uniref:C2H2-type domain-containing protein n=1 Tax=Steinernema carpocapsae TaxID=34508 RepID=A0A4U5NH18_STECR|nr:hypothetical protein L596_016115 [Steinernema carpocapsae]
MQLQIHVCPVKGCEFDEFTENEDVQRHILVHIHQVKLMARGLQTLKAKYKGQMKTLECKFSINTKLLYDGRTMICEWDECWMRFSDISLYQAHLEQHVKETPMDDSIKGYMCAWNQCKTSRVRKSLLLEHARTHVGGKTSACPMCGSLFSSDRILFQHLARSDADQASLCCSHCHKTFATNDLLSAHIRRHLKANPCVTCAAIFDSPAALKRHNITVHHGCKLYRCDLCKSSHGSASDLERHKTAVHSASPSIFCSKCDASFRWRKQLLAHEKVHNNEPAEVYSCHLCDSNYKTGFSLSRHLKSTHRLAIPTGFSRYQYKLCSDGHKRLATKVFVKESKASVFAESQTNYENIVLI